MTTEYSFSEDQPVQSVNRMQTKFLRTGELSCIYWNGTIRHLRYANREILRMVCPAVRDRNWRTAPVSILEEKIVQEKNSFRAEVSCRYSLRRIVFLAQLRIEGTESSLTFSMKGSAQTEFLKNRIGLNVLFPPGEYAGLPCSVTTPSGKIYPARFPDRISPHQPMKEIAGMSWNSNNQIFSVLEFKGDVFEMEDQRNWTDASFKVYSTPLDLPYPVQVAKGDRMEQEIRLKVSAATSGQPVKTSDLSLTVRDESSSLKWPAIGIGKSTESNFLTVRDRKWLNEIAFSHYRVDVDLGNAEWAKRIDEGDREACSLELALELALFFDQIEEDPLTALLDRISRINSKVARILIFTRDHLNSAELSKGIIPRLRQALPEIPAGTGTNANFAELNRNRPQTDLPDFLAYAITPQIHAFDPLSLVENLEAQSDTVRNALLISKGKPIVVSPVTLKPRFNAVATSEETEKSGDHELPFPVDPRQVSLFCAGWTLGSLKYLIESGVSAITYYETVGRKGIMHGDHDPLTPELFPAFRGDRYPVYYLFRELLKFTHMRIIPTESSHPHTFSSLLLNTGEDHVLAVANHTCTPIEVKLPPTLFAISQWSLDEQSLPFLRKGEDLWKPVNRSPEITIDSNAVSLIRLMS